MLYKQYYLNYLRKNHPLTYKQLLKDTKGNGAYNTYYKEKKLHIEYKIRKGVVHYFIHYRNGKLQSRGIEK